MLLSGMGTVRMPSSSSGRVRRWWEHYAGKPLSRITTLFTEELSMGNKMLILSVLVSVILGLGCQDSDSDKRYTEAQRRASLECDRIESGQRLTRVAQSILAFRDAHNGTPPSSLAELIKMPDKRYAHVEDFISPMSGRAPLKTDENGIPIEQGDYIYIPLSDSAPANLIQAYEKPENYKDSPWGQGTLVMYKYYVVEWMDIKDFEESLDRTHKWLAENGQ